MSRQNGLALPPGYQQAPAMQIATPLNDAQLVSLVAAHAYGAGVMKSPADAVADAVAIVAHSVVATAALPGLIEQVRRNVAEAQKRIEAAG